MRLLLLFAPAALMACQFPTDEYSPLLPDQRLIVGADGQDTGSALARSVGDPSLYAERLAELTERSNQGLGALIELVDVVTSLPPSYTGAGEVAWGPWQVDEVFGQLSIEELDEGGHSLAGAGAGGRR